MATRPSASHEPSPNAHLRDFLIRFFAEGPHLAALRYRICSQAIKMPLLAVARGGPGQLPPSLPSEEHLRAIVTSQINDHAFVQTLVAQSPWRDSKMAAEFVTLLLADLADADARLHAAAFNSRKLGGVPTTAAVRMQPSTDLPAALAKAIAVHRAGDAGRAAMGGITVASSCTALAVTLVDCGALRTAEQLQLLQPQPQPQVLQRGPPTASPRVASFTHRFVLLVDVTGVGLYQAWGSGSGDGGGFSSGSGTTSNSSSSGGSGGGSGSNSSTGTSGGGSAGSDGGAAAAAAVGYSLQDWLQRSPAPMSYEQAAEFARAFQEFCGFIHWDDAANALYLRLFGVDLREAAAARGLAAPGRIRSWARILEVPYVTAARVTANARLFMQS